MESVERKPAKRKPPKYTQQFVDNRGLARFYFRRRSTGQCVPLPGLPWSPEFMAARAVLLGEAVPNNCPQIEDNRKPGKHTLEALANIYLASADFDGKAPDTQRGYRAHIAALVEANGRVSVDRITYGDVQATIDKLKDKPGAANIRRTVLRVLMRLAVKLGWRKDDPTTGVDALKLKNEDGIHTWTEDEIRAYKARWPVGTKQFLALALLLNVGQRRSDTVRLGRQHVVNGRLQLRQKKTGQPVSVKIIAELREALDAMPESNMTFLITEHGAPYRAGGFGAWFRRQCDAAGLKQCSAHGLRKACATRLCDAGATAYEIAAVTGHRSITTLTKHYTAKRDQERLADSAMDKLQTKMVKQAGSA